MFNDNERPSIIKRLYFTIRTEFNYWFLFRKKFASIAARPVTWGIWNIVVYGPDIHLGKNVTLAAGAGAVTNFTSVSRAGRKGSIKIGNNVVIMSGVRISSASEVVIGDDCLIAGFCYITDADWHDVYDRLSSPGKTSPVIIERGVWLCDSAIICKGVHIGENSIVGAGSVVRRDVPPNVIVAGNPAKVVKRLDPGKIEAMRKKYSDCSPSLRN
jgi:acetyltransferase-like isoleucine patch superfamily enzyme